MISKKREVVRSFFKILHIIVIMAIIKIYMYIDVSIEQLLNHFYLLLISMINSKRCLLFKNYISRKTYRGFSLLETLQ